MEPAWGKGGLNPPYPKNSIGGKEEGEGGEKGKEEEEEGGRGMSPPGVGADSGTGCNPAWSCTPRRCDSSTAFQASRRALRLPSFIDARCLVLRRISSITRLASAATLRKATAAKPTGSSRNFPTIYMRMCALCRVLCARVCALVPSGVSL